jgi:3-oxosteroid 1-dehydrogenase
LSSEIFDFIVVGSGGGAFCAALLMAAAGKSVLVLEKTGKIGGTTCISGGILWIPNNPFMREDGVEDSYENAMTYLDSLVGNDLPGTTRERKHAFLTEGSEMISFLRSEGIGLCRIKYYPDYYNTLPGGSTEGRAVSAEIFDATVLGAWRDKLRPGFRRIPARVDEMMQMAHYKNSWKSRLLAARVAVRAVKAKILGQHWVSSGESLQGQLLHRALQRGVDVRLDAPATQLITDGHGRVCGVRAQIDGQTREVSARLGVLIGAGGFARNQRMRDKYQPWARVEWSTATAGDTGEMLEEAERVGARLAQMDQVLGMEIAMVPGMTSDDVYPPMQQQMSKPHAIVVDQTGIRYHRESVSYMEFAKAMFLRGRDVLANPSWMIFDSQYIDNYMLANSLPGRKKPPQWSQSGFLRTGRTIEALAHACDIPPENLRRTIDRFNGFVRKGHDEDFQRGSRAYDRFVGDPMHRPSPSLGSIEKGPFYAVQIFAGDIGTFGGIVTDQYSRALRKDGSVISGLYATGNSTASVFGGFYPGAGGTLGPSFTFGYIAAKHAAGIYDAESDRTTDTRQQAISVK